MVTSLSNIAYPHHPVICLCIFLILKIYIKTRPAYYNAFCVGVLQNITAPSVTFHHHADMPKEQTYFPLIKREISKCMCGSGMICAGGLNSQVLTDASWKPGPFPHHVLFPVVNGEYFLVHSLTWNKSIRSPRLTLDKFIFNIYWFAIFIKDVSGKSSPGSGQRGFFSL